MSFTTSKADRNLFKRPTESVEALINLIVKHIKFDLKCRITESRLCECKQREF